MSFCLPINIIMFLDEDNNILSHDWPTKLIHIIMKSSSSFYCSFSFYNHYMSVFMIARNQVHMALSISISYLVLEWRLSTILGQIFINSSWGLKQFTVIHLLNSCVLNSWIFVEIKTICPHLLMHVATKFPSYICNHGADAMRKTLCLWTVWTPYKIDRSLDFWNGRAMPLSRSLLVTYKTDTPFHRFTWHCISSWQKFIESGSLMTHEKQHS